MRSLATVQSEDVAAAPMRDFGPMSTQPASPAGERRPMPVVGVAAAVSFLWLAAATAAIYLIARFQPPADLSLTGLAGVAAGVTAPLTAIWLAALVLARHASAAPGGVLARIEAAERVLAETAQRTRDELDAIGTTLATVAAKVDGIGTAVGQHAAALTDATQQLEGRSAAVASALARDRQATEQLVERITLGSATASAELARVTAALPAVEQQTAAIRAALATSADAARRQTAELEDLLHALSERQQSAQAQAAAAAVQLRATISAAADDGGVAAAQLTAQAEALAASLDGAIARAAEALTASRSAVDAQVGAVAAAIEHTRTILSEQGGQVTSDAATRLARLAGDAQRLTGELGEQETRSRALVEAVERTFAVLDAKLANAAQTSAITLERLDERLAAIRAQMHQLATPLSESTERTRELEHAVGGLRLVADQTLATISSAVPEGIMRSNAAAHELQRAVAGIAGEVAALETAIVASAGHAEAGRATIGSAAGAVEAARDALETTIARIEDRLAAAHAVLGDIDAGADAAALTATTKLVEAMSRVRDVAAQAEGAMRQTLEQVAEEARSSFEAAGGEAMRTALTGPLLARLAEIETAAARTADAARGAAEQMTRQLVNLAETATAVEARIAQADRKLEEVSRDELARRAALLVDALNSAAIDITRVLSADVADSAWSAYLRGDRSIFARRAIKLIDSGNLRAITKLYESTPEFRDNVRRYVHDFEALMRRVSSERDGESLSVTLLSSDIGKLYVALGQALERFKE